MKRVVRLSAMDHYRALKALAHARGEYIPKGTPALFKESGDVLFVFDDPDGEETAQDLKARLGWTDDLETSPDAETAILGVPHAAI